MDERTLEAVRGVVAPLDFAPLFLVVAGPHAQGLAAPDSPVLVRGVHDEALGAALGAGRRLPVLTLDLLDRGMHVRVRSEDRDRTASRLARPDGTFLEALHSPLVLSGAPALAGLREIARGFATRALLPHFRREAERALRDLRRQTAHRRLSVLRLIRARLGALHLLATGEVEPDLGRLVRWRGDAFLEPLARRPFSPAFVGDPARLGFLLGEAEGLAREIDAAEAASLLPAEPSADARARLAGFRAAEKPLPAPAEES